MFPRKPIALFAFVIIISTITVAQHGIGERGNGTTVRGIHAWMTVATERAQSLTPTNINDTGLVTIFSNLASKYPKGQYWCCSGYNVMGSNSGAGEQWMAAAFTPKANHTVTTIGVGVGYSQGATNGVVISLNLDDNGKPGKALKKWSALDLPMFGTCCGLMTVSDGAGIPVNAGQQYWLVLSTNANELDTVDGWNVDDTDQIDMATLASFSGNGWTVFQATPGVAFAVKGSN